MPLPQAQILPAHTADEIFSVYSPPNVLLNPECVRVRASATQHCEGRRYGQQQPLDYSTQTSAGGRRQHDFYDLRCYWLFPRKNKLKDA